VEIDIKAVGENIRKHRAGIKMTARAVAKKTGLTPTYISRIEKCKVPGVSLDTILKISDAIGCPVSVLVGEGELSAVVLKAIELTRELIKQDERKH
jgi:transcriptional regulator with XRE-family HTH domain